MSHTQKGTGALLVAENEQGNTGLYGQLPEMSAVEDFTWALPGELIPVQPTGHVF